MKEFKHVIQDPMGLHARPAGMLNKEARKYKSAIIIHAGAKSANVLRLMAVMQLGVKFGDTVTKSEVKKAVSAKYNISSLSMYSEQAWEDYVAGKTVNSVDSIKITRGESDLFFIDVRISGTAKSSSGSGSGAAADSSNPKTGDMIFTPVVVMGTSVACLAVLFYLNKKRAY